MSPRPTEGSRTETQQLDRALGRWRLAACWLGLHQVQARLRNICGWPREAVGNPNLARTSGKGRGKSAAAWLGNGAGPYHPALHHLLDTLRLWFIILLVFVFIVLGAGLVQRCVPVPGQLLHMCQHVGHQRLLQAFAHLLYQLLLLPGNTHSDRAHGLGTSHLRAAGNPVISPQACNHQPFHKLHTASPSAQATAGLPFSASHIQAMWKPQATVSCRPTSTQSSKCWTLKPLWDPTLVPQGPALVPVCPDPPWCETGNPGQLFKVQGLLPWSPVPGDQSHVKSSTSLAIPSQASDPS